MRGLGWTLGLFLALGAAGLAEEGAPDGDDEPAGILLVQDGFGDEAMAARLREFLGQNLMIPVRAARSAAEQASRLEEAGAAAGSLLGERDICVVVLAAGCGDETDLLKVMTVERTAVVNTAALAASGGDGEKLARRLERMAVRGVAAVLGLGGCPNPHCALFEYGSMDELDSIGRGPCPPCLTRMQAAAGPRPAE